MWRRIHLQCLNQSMRVIVDRMKNPKEDSYTNAVMEKGIDEILKKLGHECTEIILAAKNPDSDDLKFEISDFMSIFLLIFSIVCMFFSCSSSSVERSKIIILSMPLSL